MTLSKFDEVIVNAVLQKDENKFMSALKDLYLEKLQEKLEQLYGFEFEIKIKKEEI